MAKVAPAGITSQFYDLEICATHFLCKSFCKRFMYASQKGLRAKTLRITMDTSFYDAKDSKKHHQCQKTHVDSMCCVA